MSEINGHLPTRDEEIWARCTEHLQPALDFWHGLHRMEDVHAAIERGDAQLWPMPTGTLVTEIREYPSGGRIVNFWLAGGTLGTLVGAEPIIADWAREQGCHAAQIIGRKGWARVLPQYREAATVLWRSLGERA